MRTSEPLRAIGAELLALLLSASCAGCDSAGALLCESCRAAVSPRPREIRTPDGLRVRAAFPMDDVVARCIPKLKDEGQTFLAPVFGEMLRPVLGEVLDGLVGSVAVVPVPTRRAAFRRRGYRVPELLIRHAGERPERWLMSVGAAADQRHLGAAARATNVRGSMRARRGAAHAAVVLVDDVVTTGATFDEATRALEAVGAHVFAGVALAATPLFSRHTSSAEPTRRK